MHKHCVSRHSRALKRACKRLRGITAQNTARSYQIAPASNRLQGFTQTLSSGTATTGASSSVLYTLDANGSLLKDGLRSYEFDAANRLANATTGTGPSAPTTRYVHNALGQRLFKTDPLFPPVASSANPADPAVALILANFAASLWGGSTTVAAPTAAEKLGFQYFYDEDGSLLSEMGTGGTQSTGSTQYIYLPTPSGPMPIALLVNATQYAVHTDHLNTPRRLTLANKTVAWQWAFSAFGDEQPTTAKNRFVDLTTSASLGSTNVADVTFNLRYPGQYFDKESGLNYNYFRSYDAKTGRYTQSDPIDLDGGWNRFAYAESNPLLFIDPEGLAAAGASIGGAIGGAIGSRAGPVGRRAGTAIGSRVGSALEDYCRGDDCEELYAKIRSRVDELKRRYSELISNTRKLPTVGPFSIEGHRQQFRNKQTNLRSLLDEARTKGCTAYGADASTWSTIEAPYPGWGGSVP
jgi:RHS repeat-associated protein